ncbi:hypothetical protein D3C85_1468580 [compost metagenome]
MGPAGGDHVRGKQRRSRKEHDGAGQAKTGSCGYCCCVGHGFQPRGSARGLLRWNYRRWRRVVPQRERRKPTGGIDARLAGKSTDCWAE